MPYTRPWVTAVSGTNLANRIDDIITQKLVDIEERFESLVVDQTADPIVPQARILGNVVGKKLLVPAHAFLNEDGAGVNYGVIRFTALASNQPLRAPLILPAQVTITRLRWLLTNDDGNAVTMKLCSSLFAVGQSVQTDEKILIKSSSGEEIVDSGVTAITIGSDRLYYLTIDKSAGSAYGLSGVEITYNTIDCRNTI